MNKKIFLGLLFSFLMSFSFTASAYDNGDLNRRLTYCTPTKNFSAGGATYQITGLTGSTCIYKIEYNSSNKSGLICKVPYSKMRDMTSFNPLVVQSLRNKYCVISIKSFNKSRTYY